MSDLPVPSIGDVWRYPFLWSREAARGEREGRKARPVAVALLTRNTAGEAEVVMVPITSHPPGDDLFAVEIPAIEKRRAGLDGHLPLWIVTDEANTDIPERSFYFEPDARLGAFSLQFIKAVQRLMIQALKARKLKSTGRR
jgi:hypothetical protein